MAEPRAVRRGWGLSEGHCEPPPPRTWRGPWEAAPAQQGVTVTRAHPGPTGAGQRGSDQSFVTAAPGLRWASALRSHTSHRWNPGPTRAARTARKEAAAQTPPGARTIGGVASEAPGPTPSQTPVRPPGQRLPGPPTPPVQRGPNRRRLGGRLRLPLPGRTGARRPWGG